MSATPKTKSQRLCTAVIADMVGSRTLDAAVRQETQRALKQTLDGWNRSYRKFLLSKFTITTGDEFQGLLQSPGCLLTMIRSLEAEIPDIQFRFGIGFGELFTDLAPTAIGMDGPVWHSARSAIVQAKTEDQLGGVFAGFGNDTLSLNSLARFLHYHFRSMTEQQRQIAERLRTGLAVKDIAEQLEIPATNVSRQKKAIVWPMLQEGELAVHAILERFDTTSDWSNR